MTAARYPTSNQKIRRPDLPPLRGWLSKLVGEVVPPLPGPQTWFCYFLGAVDASLLGIIVYQAFFR